MFARRTHHGKSLARLHESPFFPVQLLTLFPLREGACTQNKFLKAPTHRVYWFYKNVILHNLQNASLQSQTSFVVTGNTKFWPKRRNQTSTVVFGLVSPRSGLQIPVQPAQRRNFTLDPYKFGTEAVAIRRRTITGRDILREGRCTDWRRQTAPCRQRDRNWRPLLASGRRNRPQLQKQETTERKKKNPLMKCTRKQTLSAA